MVKKIWIGTVILAAAMIFTAGGVQAAGLPAGTSDRVVASEKSLADAGLPGELSTEITGAMLENRFDDEQVTAVHRMLKEALAQDLPTRPLTGKILEGIAKKVQPARIVAAVENLHARQVFASNQAKQIARSTSSVRDLAGVYTASLSAGLSRDDAKKITAQLVQSTDGQGAVAADDLCMATMKTARDMSRLGVSSDTLTKTVTNALSRGYSSDQMRDLHRSFLAGASRTDPEALAVSYGNAITAGRGVGAGPSGGQAGSGAPGRGGDPGGAGAGGASGNDGGSTGNDSGQGNDAGGGNSGTGAGQGPGNGNGSGGTGSGH